MTAAGTPELKDGIRPSPFIIRVAEANDTLRFCRCLTWLWFRPLPFDDVLGLIERLARPPLEVIRLDAGVERMRVARPDPRHVCQVDRAPSITRPVSAAR